MHRNGYIPVCSPLHGVVEHNERGSPVQDLLAESAPDVEDGSVCSAGEDVLLVGRDGVGDDALLLHAT